MADDRYTKLRYFLKDSIRQETDSSSTDQVRGIAPPPVSKPPEEGAKRIPLPAPEDLPAEMGSIPLVDAIANRHSRRNFRDTKLNMDELSWLLWATQGVRRVVGEGTAFRTVPSAGCRHTFETYLCVFRVTGLKEGIYRFLPVEHELQEVSHPDNLAGQLTEATLGQEFAAHSAVTFVWSSIPHRMEWRYAEASHKVIAIDAGHVCQNLYLACEAIGCGTCAVGAYGQRRMDALIGLDGEEEFTIYIAPVGKL